MEPVHRYMGLTLYTCSSVTNFDCTKLFCHLLPSIHLPLTHHATLFCPPPAPPSLQRLHSAVFAHSVLSLSSLLVILAHLPSHLLPTLHSTPLLSHPLPSPPLPSLPKEPLHYLMSTCIHRIASHLSHLPLCHSSSPCYGCNV